MIFVIAFALTAPFLIGAVFVYTSVYVKEAAPFVGTRYAMLRAWPGLFTLAALLLIEARCVVALAPTFRLLVRLLFD